MSLMFTHHLSLLLALPLFGALLIWSFPTDDHSGARGFGVGVMLLELLLAAMAWQRFVPSQDGLQLLEQISWVPSLGLHYAVGIDALSLVLTLLTALLLPVALLATPAHHAATGLPSMRAYVACLLLLETTLIGALLAVDMVLFYVFWEAMLVPCYFLICVWGGTMGRKAGLTFVLYTMAGSLLMLAALAVLMGLGGGQGGANVAVASANAPSMLWPDVARSISQSASPQLTYCLFFAFAAAFLIKIPLFPLHTWLPDAYVASPAPVTALLSGILVKIGAYGLIRFGIGLFPSVAVIAMPWLGMLAVIGIIYAALLAWVQDDIKRLLAYSSMSHLGFVVLGICSATTLGLTGAMMHMVSHGIYSVALFILLGILERRYMSRDVHQLGGALAATPTLAWLLMAFSFAAVGVPGLSGFVGEFLIILGTFGSSVATSVAGAAATSKPWAHPSLFQIYAAIATIGVVLSAVYMLKAVQSVCLGPSPANWPTTVSGDDVNSRERWVLLPLLAITVILGVYPKPLLDVLTPFAERQLERRPAQVAAATPPATMAAITPATMPTFMIAQEGR